MEFTTILPQLVRIPELHARFINTLSLLEYIGARKIFKSQEAGSITSDVLSHMMEELRHAQALKKVALKMSNGELKTYSEAHLLCGQEAKTYIQTVDFAAVKEFGNQSSWLHYLFTTLLLEERANQIYPFYDSLLAECGFPGVLKAIVKEEDVHLTDVIQSLGKEPAVTSSKLETLRRIESEAFALFAGAIEQVLYSKSHTGHKLDSKSPDRSSALVR